MTTIAEHSLFDFGRHWAITQKKAHGIRGPYDRQKLAAGSQYLAATSSESARLGTWCTP